jgi:dihydrodipicolinate reductase (EC 1.3.1.26)
MIRVVLAGPRGKMGREAIRMFAETKEFELVGAIDRLNDGALLPEIVREAGPVNCRVYTNPEQCFLETVPDCFIDLSIASAAAGHARSALSRGIRTVIGTTGLSSAELEDLRELANHNKVGCIVAPNFAIGAVLMMKFARMAAKYFPDVEIIEMHHDQKRDAPSGTALKTAEMIIQVRGRQPQGPAKEKESLPGVRGGDFDGVRIHSVRLPGLVAHQEILFGGPGEGLRIRHDSYNRTSFMNGIKLAIKAVMHLDGFVYGMENLID